MNSQYFPMDITELIFAGFNSRVVAMSRETGEVAWIWKSPKSMSQYVAVMLDGDILIASVSGYMFGIDPLTGATIWHNPWRGTGVGHSFALFGSSQLGVSCRGRHDRPTRSAGGLTC